MITSVIIGLSTQRYNLQLYRLDSMSSQDTCPVARRCNWWIWTNKSRPFHYIEIICLLYCCLEFTVPVWPWFSASQSQLKPDITSGRPPILVIVQGIGPLIPGTATSVSFNVHYAFKFFYLIWYVPFWFDFIWISSG